MVTLEMDLNCMCLCVPDARAGANTGTVHVLMPCTNRYAHADQHVVLMEYLDAQGTPVTVRLEGWALDLGYRNQPSASVTLALPDGSAGNKIVDLTELTRDAEDPIGRRVPRSMLNGPHPEVMSRISFHGGAISAIESQWPTWMLNGKELSLAHQVTWRMQVDDSQFLFTSLDGASQAAPLASLGQVQAETINGQQVCRLHVHHVAAKAVGVNSRPLPNALNEVEIRNHFRMFYMLLGENPTDNQLPAFPQRVRDIVYAPDFGGAEGWACKMARAEPDLAP